MITNIKKIDDQTVTFEVKSVPIPEANALKRIFKTCIPVVAFDPDQIKIHKNTTSLRDEFLVHRISMLPIDNMQITGKVNPGSITFELQVKNDHKDYQLIQVLGKDLVPNTKKVYFDPQFLLTEIKPGQELHLTAHLKLFDEKSRSIQNRNTLHIFYTYDPKKELPKGRYDFHFTLESFGSYPVNNLITLGKKYFAETFRYYLENLDNDQVFRIDEKMHTVYITTLTREDVHTIGNLLVQNMLDNHRDLEYCGYKQTHPTENICVLKIIPASESTSAAWLRKHIREALQRIIKMV